MASHFKRCRRNNAQRPSMEDQISVPIAAAEIISGNADLVVEILRRLPAKSLIRFRLVSKTWLFLISSHRFSLLHWQQQQQHHLQFHYPKISGLFFTSRCRSEFIKYIPLIHSDLKNRCSSCTTINGGEENKSLALFPDMNTTTFIEDSRNGFLLIRCLTKQSNNFNWTSYHVYNPTTKRFSTLPWPFSRANTFPVDRLYLVFDPLRSFHYKVVLLQSSLLSNAYLCQIHIYSSETNAWRRPQPNIGDHHHPFKAPLGLIYDSGVYCNGSIHWISFSPRETSIRFDVDQEIFCSMPSPPFQPGAFKFWHFGESRGHLHLIDYCDDTGFNVSVSEMESDYSKWKLKYRVGLNTMMVDLAKEEEMVVHDDMVSVLSLFHGEDEGDVFLLLFVGTNMIISYNIKDNTFKKLGSVTRHLVSSPHDLSCFKHARVHRYIETLFPT